MLWGVVLESCHAMEAGFFKVKNAEERQMISETIS
jgi:hypothetical protein